MRSLMARCNMPLKWALSVGAFLTSIATLIITTNYSKAAIISSIAICTFVIGFVLSCMYCLPNDDSHSASQVEQLDSTPQPLMISSPTVPPNPSSSTLSPTINMDFLSLLFLESGRRRSFRQTSISRRPSIFDEALYTSNGLISHYAEVLRSSLPQRLQPLVPDMEGRLLESLPITSPHPHANVTNGEGSITEGQPETVQQGGSSELGLTTISEGVPHSLEHSSDKRENSYQAIGSSSKAMEEATVSHLPAVGRVNREPCVDAVDPHPSCDSANDPQPSNDDPQPSYVAASDPKPSRDAANAPLLGGTGERLWFAI